MRFFVVANKLKVRLRRGGIQAVVRELGPLGKGGLLTLKVIFPFLSSKIPGS